MPDAESLQPSAWSDHIKVGRTADGALRIELKPTRASKVFYIFFSAFGAFATWAFIVSGGPQWMPETASERFGWALLWVLMLPILYIVAIALIWVPLGSEILLFKSNELFISKALAGFKRTDEYDLPKIQRLRYELFSMRGGFRTTISFEYDWLKRGFGKDLTEAEARWLIGVIQTRIDAAAI